MPKLCAADYGFLRQVVHDVSRNVLDPSRDYLFEPRLRRILRDHGMAGLEELVVQLRRKRNSALERAVAEAMTINETSFFRDDRLFELLRSDLLPELIQSRRSTRRLRFLSAACSTGQEAYSLAMLIREHFPLLARWEVRIEGMDISAEAIGSAKAGCYRHIEMNRGLPARFIARYFDRIGENWVVKPEIRGLCKFRRSNLCAQLLPGSLAADRFDVIFLRNVMLYFSQETRRSLLASVHRMLAHDGILFLGSSEQPADPSVWIPTLAGGACYFRPKHPAQ